MRPIDMEILLHYYVFAEEMDEVRRSVPGYVEGVRLLKQHDLIEDIEVPIAKTGPFQPSSLQVTSKGRFWLEHVLDTPLPVATWSIP